MKYADARSFRQALEQQLKMRARNDPAQLSRERRNVAFDRFLARLVYVAPGNWVLKGGTALGLWLTSSARATKDVDIEWSAESSALFDAMIDASTCDLGDFFQIEIERAAAQGDGFGGSTRFSVAVSLAGRLFDSFPVDVGFRAAPIAKPPLLHTGDLLSFAGIRAFDAPAMPLELHVAEKLHAFTRTYEGGRGSTRVKDFVDLALIAGHFELDADALRRAITSTFEDRATHVVPAKVPAPPGQWQVPFRQLANSVGMNPDTNQAHSEISAFLGPILRHEVNCAKWHPDSRGWFEIESQG